MFLEDAHILDRPHVVTVRDGSGSRLQSTRYGYGRFNERGAAITMPDTTSVWLDGNADGQVDADEWIDRQVAAAYDNHGNLTQSKDAHGTVTSTVMGYGKMRPVASFTGAGAPEAVAEVFDEYAGWDALAAAGPWRRTNQGQRDAITLEGGALSVDNAAAVRTLPALDAGVLEVDVRMEAAVELTEITLGNNRIQWVFHRDGRVRVIQAGGFVDAGARYVPGRWHHLRIAWKDNRWHARMDGVRYPETGAWDLRARRGLVDAVKLANGARPAAASFDNLRVWPDGAQPAAMTTYDPVTLDATAVTDANGHTVRYARDGLRRVIQTTDGRGRITAQRDHALSRGISAASAYNTARPNRRTDIAYASKDGHKDLSGDGHRVITRGTAPAGSSILEEGVSLETRGPYVVEAGESATLKASVRIVLGPGFHKQVEIEGLTGAKQITYHHDLAGRVTRLTYPDGA